MTKRIPIAMNDTGTPAQDIAGRIEAELDARQSVLWLVSGGSAIHVAVHARAIVGTLDPSDKLHVALVDERFGEPGHADSNERQLIDAGFDMAGITVHSVLAAHDIYKTTQDYDRKLAKLLLNVDSVIGLFGVGSDGHTAGLLPGNPLMDSTSLVGHFDGPDYQRITTTPAFISQVDEAILYGVGSAKWPVLRSLVTTDLPVACLRDARNLTVYSDYYENES